MTDYRFSGPAARPEYTWEVAGIEYHVGDVLTSDVIDGWKARADDARAQAEAARARLAEILDSGEPEHVVEKAAIRRQLEALEGTAMLCEAYIRGVLTAEDSLLARGVIVPERKKKQRGGDE